MGLKGAGPYFQRSMQTKDLGGLVYVDDVKSFTLTHDDYTSVNAMKTLIPREHKYPRRIFLKIFLDFSQPYLDWFSPKVFSE